MNEEFSKLRTRKSIGKQATRPYTPSMQSLRTNLQIERRLLRRWMRRIM